MEYTLAFFSFFLFHSLIHFVDTTDFSSCTNKSLENNIPVVSFCQESTADNGVVALGGYYAHSNTEVTTCTCVARGQAGRILYFSNFDTIQQQCASEIRVSNSNSAFIIACTPTGSITFKDDGEITIILTKQQTTADTRYCILVTLDHLSNTETKTFSITCEGHSTNVTETSTPVQTTHTKTSLTTVPDGVPPQTTTSVSVSSSTVSDDKALQTTTSITVSSSTVSDDKALQTTTSGVKSSPQKDNEMLYIGAGCGAGLVIIIVVITVVICKRCSKTKTKENRRSDKDGDHDELPYNALYVSADDNSNDEKHGNSVNRAMDNTTQDIEGNYSTVNMENQPVKTKASISPVKPAIAPKPKTKGNNKISIKHMTAPGEGGVEYAIVDKQGKVSSVEQDKVAPSMTDNTYAVVNKERKRKPGDNNTNKTKDQMSRSNELTSDECRDKNRSSTKETTSQEKQHSQYSGEGQQALKKNSNNLFVSETTNYAEIDLPE